MRQHLALAAISALISSAAQAQFFYSATPYTSIADSPLYALRAVYNEYDLEDFEDGVENHAFLTISPDPNVVILGPSGTTDSVDLDDFSLDGFGSSADSLANLVTGVITLNFAPLPFTMQYPLTAGFVWTDGPQNSNLTVTVISGLGTFTFHSYIGLGDASITGTTAEDRFIGIQWAEGIQQIQISSSGSTLEIDHVQFQAQSTNQSWKDDNSDGLNGRDLLWHRPSTGTTSLWLMNGLVKSGGGPLNMTAPMAWQPQGIGDLDSDTDVDIVWRDTSTNVFHVWLLNGQTVTTNAPVSGAGAVSTDWSVIAVADLDFNNTGDIVFRNSVNGNVNWWKMSGANKVGGSLLGNSMGLEFLGTADVNGDQYDDLLWRDTVTGVVSGWIIFDGSIFVTANVGNSGPVGSQWVASATGDLDADGRDDLIWRNTSTGVVNAWLLNGLYRKTGGQIGTIPLAWSLRSTTDLNANGNADLVWLNSSTGQINGWIMNGLIKVSGGPIQTIDLTQWNLMNR